MTTPAPRRRPMPDYLLTVYQPDGPPPPEIDLDRMGARLGALNEELRAAGAVVYSGGLQPPGTSTVLRARGGGLVQTDGPFIEAKEHLGGFTIVSVADRDEALRWAQRRPEIRPRPIEVRPFQQRA